MVAKRRAVLFSIPQDRAHYERVLADLPSRDAFPDTATPRQISDALAAGLSAAETSTVLSTPDGPARLATLAALRTPPPPHGDHDRGRMHDKPDDRTRDTDPHRLADSSAVDNTPDASHLSPKVTGQPDPGDLAKLIGPFYDAQGLQDWLHLTPDALAEGVADHRILAIPAADGSELFPAWQFTTDRSSIPHLAAILQILASGIEDPTTWAMWLCAPDEDLEGLSSAAWLAAGRDPALVLAEAARDAARWAV